MTNLNDFKIEVFGTHDGEAPKSPTSLGEVKMELYDSTYSFEELCQVVRRMKHIDKSFQANCQRIFAGQDDRWKLWMAIIYVDHITLDYSREDGSAICYLQIDSPKRIGLKFFGNTLIDGVITEREVHCRIARLTKPKARKLQYEEFHNGRLEDSLVLTKHHTLPKK